MDLENYITAHTEREPDYLRTIFRNTNIRLLNPRMQSGHYQGRLLKMFTRIVAPRNVLEIGTFSDMPLFVSPKVYPTEHT